jgi:hypothetical protein
MKKLDLFLICPKNLHKRGIIENKVPKGGASYGYEYPMNIICNLENKSARKVLRVQKKISK